MDEFKTYLRAGYPLLWVETHEEDRCINALASSAGCYSPYVWDIVGGLYDVATGARKAIESPVEIIQAVAGLPESSVLFVKDYHQWIKGVAVYRVLKNMIGHMKSTDKHIVFISPVVTIPVELEKDIVIIDFGLPVLADIQHVTEKIVSDNNLSISIEGGVLSSAVGLTMQEVDL